MLLSFKIKKNHLFNIKSHYYYYISYFHHIVYDIKKTVQYFCFIKIIFKNIQEM